MASPKQIFKRNTHNLLFKALSGLGRSFYRMYENRNHDIHSNGEEYLLKQIGKCNPKIIFDVGGNVGEYAALAAKYSPLAKIYSFEPVSKTFESLESVSRQIENIIPIKAGLYKEKKTLEINVYDQHQLSTLYHDPMDQRVSNKESIELLKGDEFIAEKGLDRIDFVKVDVEGAEMDVLVGFEDSIKYKKIRVFQFEYGNVNISTKVLLRDFHEYFENRGYILGKLYPKGVDFRKYEFKHEDFIGPNFVAIIKDDLEMKKLLC
jgi:FkbM family methyltransferase